MILRRTLTLLLLSAFAIFSAKAQQLTDRLPVDSLLRMGTLDNGATYYVRANKKDPQRANFHILYKVGALQEDDSQDGLAHFLEHMAFNGSKNFYGNQLIDYMESIGVSNSSVNAGTAQQYTTYEITGVPVVRETIIDSLLLALHDWAGFITLADEDIDNERGVIREEMRTRNTAGNRMMEKNALTDFGSNSIIARRNVIGTDDQIANFSYDQIRSFYHKWYRPDLQAFIIVGDFDPDEMVEKLKATMADVKPFDVQTPREPIVVQIDDEPVIGIYTDPELTSYSLNLAIRSRGVSNSENDTYGGVYTGLLQDMFYSIMKERFTDILTVAPFHRAFVYRDRLGDMFYSPIDGYDATYAGVTYDYGKDIDAFESLLTEMYRAKRHGFNPGELARVKAKLRSNAENMVQSSNDRSNWDYVDEYHDHFLRNNNICDDENYYYILMDAIDNITLEQLNTTASEWLGDLGWSITVNTPDKQGEEVVSEEDILAAIAKVRSSEIPPLAEEELSGEFFTEELTGSKVIDTQQGEFESIVWTLENGIKVVFKPSDLDPTDLSIVSSCDGGTALLSDFEDLVNAELYQVTADMGVADFSAANLNKLLSGKDVYASKYISQYTHGYISSCVPRDALEMFQLLYLTATAPRYDSDKLELGKEKVRSHIKNIKGTPTKAIYDSILYTVYENPERLDMNKEEVSDIFSMEGVRKLTDLYFSSARDMVFVIIGNIEPADLQPLVETYIGSLPVGGETMSKGDHYSIIRGGEIKNEFTSVMENPKVTSYTQYSGDWEYSVRAKLCFEIIAGLLETAYDKSIREEKGGTYGVSCSGELVAEQGKFAFVIDYETDDSKVDYLQPLIYAEIEEMISRGARAKDLSKVKSNYRKLYYDYQNENDFWSSRLEGYYFWGRDDYRDYLEILESITVKDIRDFAREIFTQGNLITIIQRPELGK